MKREQIIEILEKYKDIESWYFFGQESEHKALINLASPENIADEILALPLDVPSDEEMMETIWEETDVSLSLKDKEENTVAYAMYLEIIRWAIWMREEIINRNK